MSKKLESFKVPATEGEWGLGEPSVTAEDGKKYGCWNKVLRQDEHGLTLLQRFKAPPKKALRLGAIAPDEGEEVYVIKGAYYNRSGHIVAGPGTYMFNAPGARHGGIVFDAEVITHWCSGTPDEDLKMELIDFEPAEEP